MSSLSLALRAISETTPLVTERISTELSSRLQIITIFALAIITACLTAYLYSTHQLIHRLKHDLGNLKSPIDPSSNDVGGIKVEKDISMNEPSKMDEPLKMDEPTTRSSDPLDKIQVSQSLNSILNRSIPPSQFPKATPIDRKDPIDQKTMQVLVKTQTGKTFTLDVHNHENISSVKDKIFGNTNILPNRQKIIFTGQILAHDNKTLTDYNIENDSTLYLIEKKIKSTFPIFLKTIEKTVSLEVYNDQKISSLKKKIQKKEGIAPENQRLVFAGMVLLDNEMIKDYNLQKGCTLHLTLNVSGD